MIDTSLMPKKYVRFSTLFELTWICIGSNIQLKISFSVTDKLRFLCTLRPCITLQLGSRESDDF